MPNFHHIFSNGVMIFMCVAVMIFTCVIVMNIVANDILPVLKTIKMNRIISIAS